MLQIFGSMRRFAWRAVCDIPSAIGSNSLGVWFPILTALVVFAWRIARNGVQAVKQDLLIAALTTVTSYAALFVYCIVRNLYREHLELVGLKSIPPWSGYESEQQWRDAIDEQNRLLEIGRRFDGSYSSAIQFEMIRLAKDLRKMLSDNPRPAENPGAAVTQDQIMRTASWCDQIFYRYRDDFSQRVQALEDAIGKENPGFARNLMRFANHAYMQQDKIEELIVTLWSMAISIEEPAYDVR